ncbi:metallophosphoesterase [uncultured Mailhella sp.]|uniref:metallophosphoesterase family protein n=1 Tax=uncultured Mailhella sp. TaxID=1981031 RepID=UPI0025EF3EE0|nr:metallophosphoesterase [uncultured Mailhella sp.]
MLVSHKHGGRWRIVATMLLTLTFSSVWNVDAYAEVIQIVYTSDQHYGITRKTFRGEKQVSATKVNAALVESINKLPGLDLPPDGGVMSGKPVGWIDYVISTGDIANRMEGSKEKAPMTATECWEVFMSQYGKGLTVKDKDGKPAELLAVPGNHDMTNAVGFFRAMYPAKDDGALRAMHERASGKKTDAFDPYAQRVVLSREKGGLHLLLMGIWPDVASRAWMDQELKNMPKGQPALLFTHMPPDVTANRLTNPNGNHDINAKDKFENLTPDVSSVRTITERPVREHRELEKFLETHPSIRAYFHGHENFNESYNWQGPDYTVSLPVFRVDSPMKGDVSAGDETELSFLLISADTDTGKMTVREVMWNTNAKDLTTWGQTRTVPLTFTSAEK